MFNQILRGQRSFSALTLLTTFGVLACTENEPAIIASTAEERATQHDSWFWRNRLSEPGQRSVDAYLDTIIAAVTNDFLDPSYVDAFGQQTVQLVQNFNQRIVEAEVSKGVADRLGVKTEDRRPCEKRFPAPQPYLLATERTQADIGTSDKKAYFRFCGSPGSSEEDVPPGVFANTPLFLTPFSAWRRDEPTACTTQDACIGGEENNRIVYGPRIELSNTGRQGSSELDVEVIEDRVLARLASGDRKKGFARLEYLANRNVSFNSSAKASDLIPPVWPAAPSTGTKKSGTCGIPTQTWSLVPPFAPPPLLYERYQNETARTNLYQLTGKELTQRKARSELMDKKQRENKPFLVTVLSLRALGIKPAAVTTYCAKTYAAPAERLSCQQALTEAPIFVIALPDDEFSKTLFDIDGEDLSLEAIAERYVKNKSPNR